MDRGLVCGPTEDVRERHPVAPATFQGLVLERGSRRHDELRRPLVRAQGVTMLGAEQQNHAAVPLSGLMVQAVVGEYLAAQIYLQLGARDSAIHQSPHQML